MAWDIDNKYELYSITYAYLLSTIGGVNFAISYALVASTKSLRIIIENASAEVLIILSLTYPMPSEILFTQS